MFINASFKGEIGSQKQRKTFPQSGRALEKIPKPEKYVKKWEI